MVRYNIYLRSDCKIFQTDWAHQVFERYLLDTTHYRVMWSYVVFFYLFTICQIYPEQQIKKNNRLSGELHFHYKIGWAEICTLYNIRLKMMINPVVRNVSYPVLGMLRISLLLAVISMVAMSPIPQEEDQAPMPVSKHISDQKIFHQKYFSTSLTTR